MFAAACPLAGRKQSPLDNRSLVPRSSPGPRRVVRERLIAGGAICGIAVAAIAGWGSRTGKAADWLAEAVPLLSPPGLVCDGQPSFGLIMFGFWASSSIGLGLRKQ